MMWVLGNYSRFVRPGAKRIAAELNDSAAGKNMLVSAYKNTDNGVDIIVINSGTTASTIAIQCKELRNKTLRSYTTNAQENLQPGYVSGNTFTVPPRSVVTLTGKINK